MKDKIENLLVNANVEFEFIPLPEDLPVDVTSHMNFYKDSRDHALATMIYKTEKGFIAVSRRGDTKVNSKKLREALGIKRLSLASESDMESLNLTPGLVPPLGHEIPMYMDKKLLDVEYFYDGTGHKLFGLKMKTGDLLKVNGAKIIDVTAYEEQYARKRVLAGMRASGRLHLGNYLGGAKGMLALQESSDYETLYMVADMHGITTPYSVEELKKNRLEMVMDYLSVGLDPEKSILFEQSEIGLHAELAFYLSSVVTIARMQHLPTFKEKVKQYPESSTMALLNYPILMASDILIYKASLVPVGIDQEPHLEVAREVARKMNEKYGTDFPEPERFTVEGNEYVPSLLGEGKMSKSVEGSYINLNDSLDVIKDKLAKVPTDSGKGIRKDVVVHPGQPSEDVYYDQVTQKPSNVVSTLLVLVRLFEGEAREKELMNSYLHGDGLRYKELKEQLANSIYQELKPIQERRKIYENDPSLVERILKNGAEKARNIAGKTLREVKEKMGLV